MSTSPGPEDPAQVCQHLSGRVYGQRPGLQANDPIQRNPTGCLCPPDGGGGLWTVNPVCCQHRIGARRKLAAPLVGLVKSARSAVTGAGPAAPTVHRDRGHGAGAGGRLRHHGDAALLRHCCRSGRGASRCAAARRSATGTARSHPKRYPTRGRVSPGLRYSDGRHADVAHRPRLLVDPHPRRGTAPGPTGDQPRRPRPRVGHPRRRRAGDHRGCRLSRERGGRAGRRLPDAGPRALGDAGSYPSADAVQHPGCDSGRLLRTARQHRSAWPASDSCLPWSARASPPDSPPYCTTSTNATAGPGVQHRRLGPSVDEHHRPGGVARTPGSISPTAGFRSG